MNKHFAMKGQGTMTGVHFVETGADEMYAIGILGSSLYVNRRMPKPEARQLWNKCTAEGYRKVDPTGEEMPSIAQFDTWIRRL